MQPFTRPNQSNISHWESKLLFWWWPNRQKKTLENRFKVLLVAANSFNKTEADERRETVSKWTNRNKWGMPSRNLHWVGEIYLNQNEIFWRQFCAGMHRRHSSLSMRNSSIQCIKHFHSMISWFTWKCELHEIHWNSTGRNVVASTVEYELKLWNFFSASLQIKLLSSWPASVSHTIFFFL